VHRQKGKKWLVKTCLFDEIRVDSTLKRHRFDQPFFTGMLAPQDVLIDAAVNAIGLAKGVKKSECNKARVSVDPCN
jgi:hypothetical protein